MTTRKRKVEVIPERTQLIISKEFFKEELGKRLEMGQELIDREIAPPSLAGVLTGHLIN